ncbi:MAG: alpha/beta hydrolase [Balneolaceae bacterium]|nr:alpha/beta hydrolase [Balneolaceae bacterium]
MAEQQILAYHGWGFDGGAWDAWRECLPDGFTLEAFDRGYFGRPRQPDFRGKGARIVMAHSFGLHLVPRERLEEADLLVILGGFRDFHPRAARFRHRSRQVLAQMCERFSEEPEAVLGKFYANTWHPASPPKLDLEGMDRELMKEDLEKLGESTLEAERMAAAGRVCIFHGTDDLIVPKSKGRDLYGSLEPQASYFEIRNAGHALPFTHTAQCLKLMMPEAENLFPQKTQN